LIAKAAEVDARELGRIDFVIGEVTLPNLPGAMTLEDIDLTTDPLQPLGDREAIGARFEDEQILGGGMSHRPGAERLERLAGDALRDARTEGIASLEDRGGEGVRMDVQANGAAAGAERWRGISGLPSW
jgi:hypothetical protein